MKAEEVNDDGKLEGKWWVPVKGELLFNGKVASDKPITDYVLDYKVFFEDGNYTCVDVKSGDNYVLGYSYINGILRLGVQLGNAIELTVNKITKKEGIVDIYIQNEGLDIPEDSVLKPTIIDTYFGTDIYSYTLLGIAVNGYWYYNNKGEKVPCKFGNHSTSKVFNESTGEYETKVSFDFWYDTERFYFEAK